MAKTATVCIDTLEPIVLERSRRAKRLNISVRPLRGVRVAVPHGTSFKMAEQFVLTNLEWIRKHLDKVRKEEEEHRRHFNSFQCIDEVRARKAIVARVGYLAGIHGFAYNRVSIRKQKTRWGSCSAKNNLSLNIKLTLLPDELRDYVILHELLHTHIKNHGERFWHELDRLVGDSKALRSQLNRYRLDLL